MMGIGMSDLMGTGVGCWDPDKVLAGGRRMGTGRRCLPGTG